MRFDFGVWCTPYKTFPGWWIGESSTHSSHETPVCLIWRMDNLIPNVGCALHTNLLKSILNSISSVTCQITEDSFILAEPSSSRWRHIVVEIFFVKIQPAVVCEWQSKKSVVSTLLSRWHLCYCPIIIIVYGNYRIMILISRFDWAA